MKPLDDFEEALPKTTYWVEYSGPKGLWVKRSKVTTDSHAVKDWLECYKDDYREFKWRIVRRTERTFWKEDVV